MRDVVVGVFVGGRSSRMGVQAKGLLRAPGSDLTIAARLVGLAKEARLRTVLVGRHDAYAGLGLEMLGDEPSGIGPLGGLVSLLCHAGDDQVVALACDLPHITGPMLDRLVSVDGGPIVAPRVDGWWQPFFARYDARAVLPFVESMVRDGRHKLRSLFDEAGAVELDIDDEDRRALRDWDTPDDVARDGGRIA